MFRKALVALLALLSVQLIAPANAAPHVYKDIACETTSTTGTGTITLGGAMTGGYVTFATAGVSNGDTVPYRLWNSTNIEVGWGTYTSSGTTLSRTLVASTTGSLLSLSGTYNVCVAATAQTLQPTLYLPSGGVINFADGNYTLTQSSGLLTANGAFSVGTSNAVTAGTIELGNATDTTLSRSAAGTLAVEGNDVLENGGPLGTPSSGTLTNATGLPVAGITSSTSTALGVGSLELGAVSDTTIARSSAGHISVEGSVVGLASNDLSFFTASTSNAIGVGTIELGNASDTTLSRSSAGVLACEGSVCASGNGMIADIAFVVDGGGSTITTGMKGYLEVPFACTINRATLLADQSGSIVVNVWKTTYSSFDAGSTHPVSADKITASAPPTITTATKAQDSTLTGWTTSISAGDVLAFNVDSVTTVQRATLSLKCTKS